MSELISVMYVPPWRKEEKILRERILDRAYRATGIDSRSAIYRLEDIVKDAASSEMGVPLLKRDAEALQRLLRF